MFLAQNCSVSISSFFCLFLDQNLLPKEPYRSGLLVTAFLLRQKHKKSLSSNNGFIWRKRVKMAAIKTFLNFFLDNGTAHIRHQCMKTTVFSCHRCLINTGVEKKWTTFIYRLELWPQMSLSKSKCWYSNNCLHFVRRAVPLHV